MTAHIPQYKLSYISVPKNACSSLKKMLFRLEKGRDLQAYTANGALRTVHHVYPSKPYDRWRQQMPAGHWTFAVLRDPLDRLISTYTNKILQLDVLRDMELEAGDLDRGLTTRPSLPEFVRFLGRYRGLSREIRRHTDPQVTFLGPDPAFFDRLYPMQALPELAEDLEKRTGQTLTLGQNNASTEFRAGLPALSQNERAKLEDFYAEDYAAYGALF
ncbi:sulfotransferase family 2 domain-containing protein [Oceanibium sediminis]|uniref:sulfotransferase family 2 domain-containing protein n=1 Tax=Oceanibium sediminis TaxID=2026339 RepID=UPI0013008F1B|nr:sulfotransferase family 2 domain-containing protein [Oceanibium sediminis]